MKRSLKVFNSKTIEEINNYFNSDDVEYKLNSIDMMRIFINSDIYNILKEVYKLDLNKKQKDRLDFIQYLYFLDKEDNFNIKRLKNHLKKSEKYGFEFLYEFLEEKTAEGQNEIYEKYFSSERSTRGLYKHKILKNYIQYCYLQNLNREEVKINKFLEKKILIKLKKIIKNKQISAFDMMYLYQIIAFIFSHYISICFFNDRFFVKKDLLYSILDKFENSIKIYHEIINEKRLVDFNEMIVSGYQLLVNRLNASNDEKEKLTLRISEFIEKNSLRKSTKFIYKAVTSPQSVTSDDFLEQVELIVNKKEEGEILGFIFNGAYGFKKDMSEYKDYAEKLEKIYNELDIKKVDKFDLINLKLGIMMIKFWGGEKFNLDDLTPEMKLSPVLKLCIQFENNELNYNDFIKEISSLNKIDSATVMNWDRLNKIFENVNSMEWFIILSNKFVYSDFSVHIMKNYISRLYVDIANSEKFIIMSKFKEFDDYILKRFNECVYKYYSISIYIKVYNFINNEMVDPILTLLDEYDILKGILDEKSFSEFMYMLTSFSIEIMSGKLRDRLLQIIENENNYKKNAILLYGLSFDNKHDLENNYDIIFEEVKNIYLLEKEITRFDYSILSQINLNQLKSGKEIILSKNPIFNFDNSFYVLNSDKNEKYVTLYKKLGLNFTDEMIADVKISNILYLMTARIFYSKIEEMKFGKIIKTPAEAKGKELLEILEKETGLVEIRKNIDMIRAGEKIDSTWFNVYDIHSFLKDIELANNMIFKNTKNDLIIPSNEQAFILHISSLILLVKIDCSDYVLNDSTYITSSIYDEIMKKKSLDLIELTDGVFEPRVNYDELFEKVCDLVQKMYDNGKVIDISSANILGIRNLQDVNEFDRDLIKYMVTIASAEKQYFIISEDPNYYENILFKNRSYGVYTYLISLYANKRIDSEVLLQYTRVLKNYNYGFNISNNIFAYIVSKSDNDNNLLNSIEILRDTIKRP